MKRVLAVDYSTVAVGFAVVGRKQGEPFLRHSEMLDWDRDVSHRQRRWQVAQRVQELVTEWEPDAVVFEALRLFNKGKINLTTIIRLCAMCTEIADAVPESVPSFTVQTQTWKKIALGDGRATKADCVRRMKEAWGKDVTHDEADAIGIGVAVMRMGKDHRARYLRRWE